MGLQPRSSTLCDDVHTSFIHRKLRAAHYPEKWVVNDIFWLSVIQWSRESSRVQHGAVEHGVAALLPSEPNVTRVKIAWYIVQGFNSQCGLASQFVTQ